jgi:hypothetical protein
MPLQIPQIDGRDFQQIRDEAVARIPVHTPEWNNLNLSDPGMTLVELFAYMTDNLLYRANRVPERNRATFLSLLGIPLQPATPARGLVTFANQRGPRAPWPLDAGAELRAGQVPFRSRTALCILPVAAAVFYKKPRLLDDATRAQYDALYNVVLEQPGDALSYYTSTPLEDPAPGKPPAPVDLADPGATIDRSLWLALLTPPNVPADDVRAAIAGQTLALGVAPSPRCQGLALAPQTTESQAVADPGLVFEIAVPDPNLDAAAYRRLPLDYAENVLELPGIVQLRLPEYDAIGTWQLDVQEEGTDDFPPLVEDRQMADRIVTWIRIRWPGASGQGASAGGARLISRSARLSWIGVNAARVIQAVAVQGERLGVGSGAPDQSFKVANTPVLLEDDPAQPGAGMAGFLLEVQRPDGSWETWQRTDDLWAAGPNDRVYTVDPEAGLVTGGSGLRGFRFPRGMPIRVSYESTRGPDGLVAIGAIDRCTTLPAGIKPSNPLATWGASASETVADGERDIPRYLKHHDRLVTATDFRDLARRTPGVEVGRAEVLPLFNPLVYRPDDPPTTWPGTVTVLVIPRADPDHPRAPEPDRLFLSTVCAWLDPRRLITTELYVYGPEYVSVWVSVGITTLPGRNGSLVRGAVQAAIEEYLSPLVGGPAVPSDPTLDPDCSAGLASPDPCTPPKGTGWLLFQDVVASDLETIAARVDGVRRVQGVQLAYRDAGGTLHSGVGAVRIRGLQLPRLEQVGVREGDPEDVGALAAPNQAGGQSKPVPVLPKVC